MSGRDYQRSKVYRWEEGAIAPRSSRTVPFDACQGFVDGVFLAHGWFIPRRSNPSVRPLKLSQGAVGMSCSSRRRVARIG
jgi:hypothetical protein